MPEIYPTYKDWKRAVNRIISKHFGLSLDDLPDLTFPRDAFESGETPEDFFQDQIREVMVEEFGAVVNEVWPGNDEPEQEEEK